MKTWIVSYFHIPAVLIDAESADDALREARKIDRRYNTTQVLDGPDCLGMHLRQHPEIKTVIDRRK